MSSSKVSSPNMDSMPEYYHYEDTGCEISRSCLNCPLSRCRYDDPEWFNRHIRLAKDLRVWRAIHLEGLSAQQAAQRFSITVRTVFRIVRRCQNAGQDLLEDEMEAFVAAA